MRLWHAHVYIQTLHTDSCHKEIETLIHCDRSPRSPKSFFGDLSSVRGVKDRRSSGERRRIDVRPVSHLPSHKSQVTHEALRY
jgi:hypothetical protein